MHTYRKPNLIPAGWSLGILMSALPPRLVLAAEEEAAAGLPQLDFTTWPTQIFWLVVSFAVAYLLMWRVVVPSIGGVLEARHTRIEEDLKRARLAADEASTVREGVEQQLAEARTTASNHTRQASEAIAKKLAGQIQTANQALGEKIAASETAITNNKNKVLAEATSMAAVAAAAATEKLTAIKTSTEEAGECVASFVKVGAGSDGNTSGSAGEGRG